MIIKDQNLKIVAKSVKPDAKKRVVLPKSLVQEGIIFYIYSNDAGQILLDPHVTIPASEAWLFKNKAALASVDKGMVESANGQTTDRGSFVKHKKDAP